MVAMNLFIWWRLDRSPWSSKRVGFRLERRSAKSPVNSEFTLGLAAGVNRVGGIKRHTQSLRIAFDCEDGKGSREESIRNEFVRPGQNTAESSWVPESGNRLRVGVRLPERRTRFWSGGGPRGFRRCRSTT